MRSGIIFQGFQQGYRTSEIILPCTIKISKSPPVQHPNLLIRAVRDGGQQETAAARDGGQQETAGSKRRANQAPKPVLECFLKLQIYKGICRITSTFNKSIKNLPQNTHLNNPFALWRILLTSSRKPARLINSLEPTKVERKKK